jgi:hypothetical protein
MAMTAYDTLPSFNSIVGVFSFKLYSTFADLDIPSANTVKEVGDVIETANIDLGFSEIGNMKMSFREDYSAPYAAEGFWFKVLSSECWLRVYLDGTFFFFGIVQPETIDWSESYIGATRIRVVTFELLSIVSKLMQTSTADWLSAAYDHRELTGNSAPTNDYSVISLTGLMAALIHATPDLNTGYYATDGGFINDGVNFDIGFFANGGYHGINEVFLPVTYDSGSGEAKVDYFDPDPLTNSGNYLADKFSATSDLWKNISRNFGVVMRTDYDTVTERHLIRLIQRGRAYADADNLDFSGREKSSTISKSTDLIGDAVKCTSIYNGDVLWFSQKYIGPAVFWETEPDKWVTIDIDQYIPFLVHAAAPTGSGYPIYVGSTAASLFIATGVRYHRYDIPDDDVAGATGAKLMLEVVAGYLFHRFTTEQPRIIRRYALMSAKVGAGAESHGALTIHRRTTIDDGLATYTYYANKVTKKPMTSEVEIEWLKE